MKRALLIIVLATSSLFLAWGPPGGLALRRVFRRR